MSSNPHNYSHASAPAAESDEQAFEKEFAWADWGTQWPIVRDPIERREAVKGVTRCIEMT